MDWPYGINDDARELIEDFIDHFASYGYDVIRCFTTGNCYWFAKILEERFGEVFHHGEMVYHPIKNHFAYRDNRTKYVYDITGVIDGTNYVAWREYALEDPLHTQRLIEDCILLRPLTGETE